jgi:hypothetical protein
VNLAEFLDHLPTKPSLTRKPATKPVANRTKTLPNDRKKLALIGLAVPGVMILLAGMVINMKTKSGDATLVVTVNEPGAEVQVLNEKDTVEIKSGNTESIAAKLVPLEKAPIAGGKPLEKAAVAAGKPWESPAFQQWVKDVQGMPAEKQVEAVTRKLKELNPGFDGKISAPWNESSPAIIQDGKVVEVRIFGDKFADLSPIRALSELRRLSCWARQDTGEPLDLSPLNGTKIAALGCFGRHPDLSMVKGLQLSELGCIGGGITDLNLLSGAPLKSLGVSGNWEIKSLEPLKGMPLTVLACDNSQVADLSPLRGMPLTYLVCHVTNVADLSPLKGMPLETLNCDHTPVKDLSPLAGLKLKRLSFTPNPDLKGLQAIRQMDSLVEIGTAQDKMISSSEFWKKYDAGEFAK